MQDIIKPTKEPSERAAYVLLAYIVIVTIAVILLAIGFVRRGHEINRLEVLKEAYVQEAANNADLEQSPTPLPDPCGLEVVICPNEQEGIGAKTLPNAKNGTTKASYYDYSINGQPWSKDHRTTASREFSRGTMLEVCHAGNCVEVLVNDYGPSAAVHPDRGLDLSSYAFSQLAPLSRGVIEVTYREIGTGEYQPIK